jgi:hypothetical protein
MQWLLIQRAVGTWYNMENSLYQQLLERQLNIQRWAYVAVLNHHLYWQVTRLKTFIATIPVHVLTLEVFRDHCFSFFSGSQFFNLQKMMQDSKP